jgi:hypothetical protein
MLYVAKGMRSRCLWIKRYEGLEAGTLEYSVDLSRVDGLGADWRCLVPAQIAVYTNTGTGTTLSP